MPWTSARRWEKEEASWRSSRLLRSTTSSTRMRRRAKPSTLTANMAADLYFGCRTGKTIVKFSRKRNLFFMYILFRGYDDITGTVNVTYFGDESPFELTTMWRKNNPKSTQRPFCVATRLGGFLQMWWIYQNLFKRGRVTTVGLIQTVTSVRVPMVGIGRHLKDLKICFFDSQQLFFSGVLRVLEFFLSNSQ